MQNGVWKLMREGERKWGGIIDWGEEERKEEERARPRTCHHSRNMRNHGEPCFCFVQRVQHNLMDFSERQTQILCTCPSIQCDMERWMLIHTSFLFCCCDLETFQSYEINKWDKILWKNCTNHSFFKSKDLTLREGSTVNAEVRCRSVGMWNRRSDS